MNTMPDVFISDKLDKHKEPKKVMEAQSFLNSLSSFWYYPKSVSFDTIQKEEKVVLLLRRHPITNIPWLVVVMIMLLAPTLLGVFPFLSFLPGRFQLVAIMGWYLIIAAYTIESFLNWFFNVNIVTDKRVIDIDFNSLIYKEVSDCDLSKIQDITYRMLGVIRTIFNYGDVFIQTAAEIRKVEFHAVPKPDHVVKILQDMRDHGANKPERSAVNG